MERVLTGTLALFAVPLRPAVPVHVVLPETGDYDVALVLHIRDGRLSTPTVDLQRVPDPVTP